MSGTVLEVLSTPEKHAEKRITSTEIWKDGVFQEKKIDPAKERTWWEIKVKVDEDGSEPREKVLEFATKELAEQVRPGHTYQF